MSIFDKVSIIIPSYKPDEKLMSTLRNIIETGFTDIIVVDDGGGEAYAHIFDEVKTLSECTVLHHEVNRGKGAALKTAFTYYLENRPDSLGLVTADADGQHLSSDILRCAEVMVESQSIVLGVRDFSGEHVPARSKTGNRFTTGFFKVFFGKSISDTQTGLRAIPKEYVAPIAGVKGDRYEYETHMLFLISKRKMPLKEQVINTVYIDDNSSSHFRVVRDSLRIYKTVLMFALFSIIATLIDIGSIVAQNSILSDSDLKISFFALAVVYARILSGIINYLLNRKFVFDKDGGFASFFKYLLVLIPIFVFTAGPAYLLDILSAPIWLAWLVKIVISILLFPLSFRLQHNFVFNKTTRK